MEEVAAKEKDYVLLLDQIKNENKNKPNYINASDLSAG